MGCKRDYSHHGNLNRHLKASAHCQAIIDSHQLAGAPPIRELSFAAVPPVAAPVAVDAVPSPGEAPSPVPAVAVYSPGLSVRSGPLGESPGLNLPSTPRSSAKKRKASVDDDDGLASMMGSLMSPIKEASVDSMEEEEQQSTAPRRLEQEFPIGEDDDSSGCGAQRPTS